MSQKRVDVNRFETNSLINYVRVYRLPQGQTRADLVQTVSRHFHGQQFMLNEEEVLINFIRMVKADGLRRKQQSMRGGVQKKF